MAPWGILWIRTRRLAISLPHSFVCTSELPNNKPIVPENVIQVPQNTGNDSMLAKCLPKDLITEGRPEVEQLVELARVCLAVSYPACQTALEGGFTEELGANAGETAGKPCKRASVGGNGSAKSSIMGKVGQKRDRERFGDPCQLCPRRCRRGSRMAGSSPCLSIRMLSQHCVLSKTPSPFLLPHQLCCAENWFC